MTDGTFDHPAYRPLPDRFLNRLSERLGDRLVSLVLFGSVSADLEGDA